MKRFFSILLCLSMFLGCSLTAFAGGPITEEDELAANSMENTAAVMSLPSGLSVGKTYTIKSMASGSTSYMLNVHGGNDNDGTAVDMWQNDGSPEQRFKIISTGAGYKLEALCSSKRVLDAYRPLKDGCKADIWEADDDQAQVLTITNSNSSGYYNICLASNPTLALTAVSLTNGGAVQFKTLNANSNNQKWKFIQPNDTLQRTPDPDCQNKNLWCWAACVKMVAVHNSGGLNPEIDTAPQILKNTDGLHKTYYGYNTVGGIKRYFADGVQYAIVKYIKDVDENLTGNDTESVNALQFVSTKNMNVGHSGYYKNELPQSEINKINKDLLEGRYVIGSMTSRESINEEDLGKVYGHSVVIQKYYPGTNGQEGKYDIFDPFTGNVKRYYQNELFGDSFGYISENRDCRISWYKWCR